MIYIADHIFPIEGESIINGYVEIDEEGIILSYGSSDSLDAQRKASAEYLVRMNNDRVTTKVVKY